MPDAAPFAIALVCFATGILSSAAYTHFFLSADLFNQPRRRASKSHVVGQAGFAHCVISRKLLLEALSQVKEEETPKTPALRESYFVTQVSVGELLATQGPDFHLAAAIAFFKALHLYPLPIDLVMIYQNHVPEPIFKLVMDLMYLDGHPRLIPISSTNRFQRRSRTPHHYPIPPRFTPLSSSFGSSRVRALPRKDKADSIAISPSQRILHKALRSCRRRISFA